VCDATSKICYSSYSDAESGMTFGVALPKEVKDPYDAIIKITAPVANTWAGFSWGGNMVWNPLTVAWANGKSGIASARFALYVCVFGQLCSFSLSSVESACLCPTMALSTSY
jgi:hypothetical protein